MDYYSYMIGTLSIVVDNNYFPRKILYSSLKIDENQNPIYHYKSLSYIILLSLSTIVCFYTILITGKLLLTLLIRKYKTIVFPLQ